MILTKKKYFLLAIFLLIITLTSFFLFMNRPKTNKYTKARLVFEHILNKNIKV